MALRYDDISQVPPALREQLIRQGIVPGKGEAKQNMAEQGDGTAGRSGAVAKRSGAVLRPGGKYGNRKATVDGITFDSRKEASRFLALRALEDMGMIWDLRLQVDFTLQEAYTTSDGERVRATRYKADFTYYMLEDGQQVYVVEDVKSSATRTRVYLDKRKRMLDKFGIRIREV